MKLIDILVEELPKSGGWLRDVKTMTQDRVGNIWGYDCVSPRLKGDLWSSKSGDDLVRDSKIEARNLAVDWNTAIITREQYEAALAAKNDGWIDWCGGECPVPRGTLVDVRYRDGRQLNALSANDGTLNPRDASFVFWRNDGSEKDIIAYRLHKTNEAERVRDAAWNAYAAITEGDDGIDLNECIGQDAAQVWNGEGLPPVGCECEYTKESLPGNEWTQCTVDYVGSSFVVYRDCYGVELTGIIGDIKFRPIRSEADKKRYAAIESLFAVLDSGVSTSQDAIDIYDAIAAGKIPGVKLEG